MIRLGYLQEIWERDKHSFIHEAIHKTLVFYLSYIMNRYRLKECEAL